MPPVVRVEQLGKSYRLGLTHAGSVRELVNHAAARLLGRPPASAPRDPRSDARTDAGGLFWALRDVSFEVHPGEVVGIIGRNGAGKSTLLKILSRITPPTTGRVELHGRVASLLEVGTGFHPELTGRENIYLNGTILGLTRAEVTARLDEIVAFAEVDQFLDTPVKRYSSGMTVRLAFAVAAHLDPEILIIDEVLAVGDVDFQRKCLGRMRVVADEGRTILFVSHNMLAVQRLCDRVMLLRAGAIAVDGLSDLALTEYLSEKTLHTAQFDLTLPTSMDAPGFATHLTVEDQFGHPNQVIRFGEPWQVRVDFTILNPVEHFVIGLGLKTSTDSPIRTSWAEPRQIKPGKYSAVFREEHVHLSCGRYSLVVGLSQYHRNFHYVDNAGQFEISAINATSSTSVIDPASGIISNRMEISITGHAVRSLCDGPSIVLS